MADFGERLRPDQVRPPAVVEPGQSAAGLAQGLPRWAAVSASTRSATAFAAGEVDLAVFEGAAGELAGLRQPAAAAAPKVPPARRR